MNDQIQLSFHEENVADKDHASLYVPRPEITHQFNVPEKRPAAIVSLVFSGLTILPLLVLLILVRINGFLDERIHSCVFLVAQTWF